MESTQALLKWFRSNARDLPWRTEPREPYRTLVSEVMLQQTQVDRVVPRFDAFIAEFPDLPRLASATEDQVVAKWSGLGYYRSRRLGACGKPREFVGWLRVWFLGMVFGWYAGL
ncbi:MAG: hypothetical protein K8R59_07645 [Thermoanaerobaculales bacterium]|nr:hypothetical protein [Thermoanaerobaculales bacterium]